MHLSLAIIKKIIFIFIIFSVLFGVKYKFPIIGSLNSIVLSSLFGIILWMKRYKTSLQQYDVSIFKCYIFIIIIYVITSIINSHTDIYFIKELVVANIARFFAAYLVMKLFFQVYQKELFYNFTNVIALLVSFQVLISIASFLFPSIHNYISLVTVTSTLTQTKIEGALTVRAIGIGDYVFYGAGVLNCCILILIAIILSVCQLNNKQIFKFIFLFLFISFGGLFLSRTTMVGTCIGLIIIIMAKQSVVYRNIKYFAVIIGVFILCLSFFLDTQMGKDLNGLREYGLELFDNYINGEGFSSKSTNHLKEMFIYPSSIKSWIIGDGKWRIGDIYYMHTDVGYLRLIFFCGLIGLFASIMYFYTIIRITGEELKLSINYFFIPYLLLFLTLSMKGFTDISLFIFLLYNLARFSSSTNLTMTRKVLYNLN